MFGGGLVAAVNPLFDGGAGHGHGHRGSGLGGPFEAVLAATVAVADAWRSRERAFVVAAGAGPGEGGAPPKPPKPLYGDWKKGRDELPMIPQSPELVEREQERKWLERKAREEAAAASTSPVAFATRGADEDEFADANANAERRRSSLLEFMQDRLSRRASSMRVPRLSSIQKLASRASMTLQSGLGR